MFNRIIMLVRTSNMLIVNEQFHFSFEIPDEYEEIPQSDYLMYHIDKASTLHIFIKYDTIPHTISINRDDFVEDEKDYEALVLLNFQNMERMNMKIEQHIHYQTSTRRVDTIYSRFAGIRYVTYFTTVHNLMIACSVEIQEINDENDKTVNALFESIKDID